MQHKQLFTSGGTMEVCRLLWKTNLGRKFQRLTDFCHSICRLSFSVQYKCLPFLLVCPGGNNLEAAVRCCDKTFLRSHTTYQQTAQFIWQSSLHINWPGPPLTFHCTGSAYVQWRIGGRGHENFSTPTSLLTSVQPPPADLTAPRQTFWAMSPLHCIVRMCSEGGDDISTRYRHFSVLALP